MATLSDSEHQSLTRLLAKNEIWECIVRYARAVDRLDEDLLRTAFWPDAHDSHGHIDGTPQNFIYKWMHTQADRNVCQHFVSNHHVEFDDSGAHSETYFQVAAKQVNAGSMELLGGRYIDHFECREGEWRIATRVVILDWVCVTDASMMTARLRLRHHGTRDRQDPSYERPVHARPLLK
jgi:hypothetical protein